MQKKLILQVGARCNRNFFNIAVNDLDAKKFARYSQMLVVTELVASGTQGCARFDEILLGARYCEVCAR